jgi:hypothetical protein
VGRVDADISAIKRVAAWIMVTKVMSSDGLLPGLTGAVSRVSDDKPARRAHDYPGAARDQLTLGEQIKVALQLI